MRLLLRNSAGRVLLADGTSVALMFGQLKIILLKTGEDKNGKTLYGEPVRAGSVNFGRRVWRQ
jgi:hypothetical protein